MTQNMLRNRLTVSTIVVCERTQTNKACGFDQSTIEVELFCLVKMTDSKCDQCIKRNIAKGTTDPRVTKVTSFGHITSSYKNLDRISSSESGL